VNHLTLHQLSAYLDGELTEASTELVRLHLSQCAACTERFARMEAQEENLVRLLRHDPGEAFFEFFRSAIDLDGREASPTWPGPEPIAAG
jgi:anti-sigma factor RsiW